MDPMAAPVLAGRVLGPGGAPASDWAGVTYAVVALTVLLLAALGAILLARRYLFRGSPKSEDGFELQDIRRLLADGKISQEEYDHLKERMVSRLRARRGGHPGS